MRTFLVCNNVDCHERGSEAVFRGLLRRLDDEQVPDVEVRQYLCFSACTKGPNVVCPEDRVWYRGVREDDVAEIVDRHARDGETVERLRGTGDSTTENMLFATLDAGLLPGEVC